MEKKACASVVIMNFTGVYDYERFAHNKDFVWLDCRHLSGVDCYCDDEGSAAVKRLIADYPAEGIHFIDSGNYHYLTRFWTDKLNRPFSLIVFDHHPDMQPPLFEHILSCGSWVKDVIDTNVWLRKVLIVGASDALIREVPEEYGERVHFFSESAVRSEEAWRRLSAVHIAEPVYVSVDKDVLNPEYAVTNWDQGSLTLKDLEASLSVIMRNEKVIGIDICGECSPTLDILEERRESELDGMANGELLRLFVRNGKHG